MAYVTYEYNKDRIKQWRLDNLDAYRDACRIRRMRCYYRNKDPYEKEAYRLRRINL